MIECIERVDAMLNFDLHDVEIGPHGLRRDSAANLHLAHHYGAVSLTARSPVTARNIGRSTIG
jgi:hypothetical protein